METEITDGFVPSGFCHFAISPFRNFRFRLPTQPTLPNADLP